MPTPRARRKRPRGNAFEKLLSKLVGQAIDAMQRVAQKTATRVNEDTNTGIRRLRKAADPALRGARRQAEKQIKGASKEARNTIKAALKAAASTLDEAAKKL